MSKVSQVIYQSECLQLPSLCAGLLYLLNILILIFAIPKLITCSYWFILSCYDVHRGHSRPKRVNKWRTSLWLVNNLGSRPITHLPPGGKTQRQNKLPLVQLRYQNGLSAPNSNVSRQALKKELLFSFTLTACFWIFKKKITFASCWGGKGIISLSLYSKSLHF